MQTEFPVLPVSSGVEPRQIGLSEAECAARGHNGAGTTVASSDVVPGDASCADTRRRGLGARRSAGGNRRDGSRSMDRRADPRGGAILRITVRALGAKARPHRRSLHPRASRESRRDGRAARPGGGDVRLRRGRGRRRAHRPGDHQRGAHPPARRHRYLPHRGPIHRGRRHVQLLARRSRRSHRRGHPGRLRHAQRALRSETHHQIGLRAAAEDPRVLFALRRAARAAQGGRVSLPRRRDRRRRRRTRRRDERGRSLDGRRRRRDSIRRPHEGRRRRGVASVGVGCSKI